MQGQRQHGVSLVWLTTVTFLGSVILVSLAATPSKGGAKSCGPPTYCARTDWDVEPYPAIPPKVGAAGSVIHDPSFGSRILRVTDNQSDPDGKGRSFMTPASANQNAWNADGSHFYVITPAKQYVLLKFDGSTMRVSDPEVLKVPWSSEPEFSYTRRNILYGVRYRDPVFQQYDISTRQLTPLHRISQCTKLGEQDFAFTVSVSADDQRMSTVLGPQQDFNYMIYVYDRKLGCRWYNTQTGEVGGEWGSKGSISAPDRFRVHTSKMSKSGNFIWIDRGLSTVGKSWLVWEIGTSNVTACPAQCSGHVALGYSHILGPSGPDHPLDERIRPINQLTLNTPLINGLKPVPDARLWYDQHLSWNHISPDDTNPACLSTYTKSSAAPGAPLDAVEPWQNEILCLETDGKGSKVWRFSHTYSTASNGFWSSPRGNLSQDGRFYLFTSDWQDQLGETSNGQHRTDVFMVELK